MKAMSLLLRQRSPFFTRTLCIVLVLYSPYFWAQSAESAGKFAQVKILTPKAGAIIAGTSEITLEAQNTTLMPARITHPESGHFHILINASKLPAPGQPPEAKTQIKLEKGQKSTELTLPPGQHTIQALFVDSLHRAHQPVVSSEKITVTVVAPILQPLPRTSPPPSKTKRLPNAKSPSN
ncbi:MAG: DUF4399 domain-containing protein [Agarilytica sp.]